MEGKKVTLRISNKQNWGLFQIRPVSQGNYVRYPRCGCPECTGKHHAVLETIVSQQWVALYVHKSRENVLAWAKQFCMEVVDMNGNPVAELAIEEGEPE